MAKVSRRELERREAEERKKETLRAIWLVMAIACVVAFIVLFCYWVVNLGFEGSYQTFGLLVIGLFSFWKSRQENP